MTVAEKTLLSIIERWRVYTREHPDSFQYDLRDDLAFAFLLVAHEHSERVVGREAVLDGVKEIQRKIYGSLVNLEAAMFTNVTLLPWNLAADILSVPPKDNEMAVLGYYVKHDLSDLRLYCMRGAWLIKERLPRREFATALLTNVADKLGHIELSALLARRLFESDADFFAFAEAFQPPAEFEEQYRDRIEQLRDDEILVPSKNFFLSMEQRLRKLIMDVSMELGVGEESPVQREFEFR